MNIILLGPQGSGKGTQATRLSQKYHLDYFEAGAIARNIAKTRPEIDAVVNKKGALLPDEVMFELVKTELVNRGRWNNILFDGYPRSLIQYEMLTKLLNQNGAKIDKAVVLQIPEEETIRRLSARRMDPVSGEIYNLITNPPPAEVDQTTLVHRDDDQPDAIRTRLAAYHSSTAPLVEKLRSMGILIEVDGTKSIDEIFNILCQEIEK